MILRSVMKHVRDQDWLAVSLDFLIVVVGVFIGIQVANWNEAQEEQRRLNEQLSSLRAEFVENLDRFNTYGDLLQRKIADIHALRRLISGSDSNVSESELDAMLMNTFSVPVFTADRTTLEELKRSGTLRDLNDIGLRRPLVDWDEAYAGLGRLEGDAITLRNLIYAPFAMAHLGFGAMGEQYGEIGDRFARSPFRNDAGMLRDNRQFDNILVLMGGAASRCLDFLEILRNRTETTITRLEMTGGES